jgi:hypothetical protein
MKVSLSLNEYNRTLKNLQRAGVEIPNTLRSELINQSYQIRDRAKQILEDKSQKRTNKKYWTGNLQSSIRADVVEREGQVVGISIGPDLREAKYAEWVEIGHFTGLGGGWWEGYHYLEGAYTEIAPKINDQITRTLKVTLRHFEQGSRTRHRTTGRFVKGFTIN